MGNLLKTAGIVMSALVWIVGAILIFVGLIQDHGIGQSLILSIGWPIWLLIDIIADIAQLFGTAGS